MMTQTLDSQKNSSILITDTSQLVEFFNKSFKPKSEFKLGVEFEKIGVEVNTHKAIGYTGKTGISAFLRQIKDQENCPDMSEGSNILGLKCNEGDVTLEPGNQVEYSTKPFKSLKDIENAFNDYNQKTGELAEKYGITWLGCGIQPLSTYDNIEMIPKQRYGIMRRYLPTKGDLSPVMMKETAGMQVCIDYESEEDASRKLKILIGLSPIITAMFANSPIRAGKLNGYKSFRAHAWLSTDNDRCGLISKDIFFPKSLENNFGFEDYVNVLLDVPMFFIQRKDQENGNQLIDATNMTFRQYMQKGLDGHQATMDDWFLHMTTFFPDIRLKNYLEVRNCDCQRKELAMALPALIKGLMYNDDALAQAEEIANNLGWEGVNDLRNTVPKQGLDADTGKYKLSELAKELVSFAETSLGSDEAKYLENLKELVQEGKTPADVIIQNWSGRWNGDLSKFIEYSGLY